MGEDIRPAGEAGLPAFDEQPGDGASAAPVPAIDRPASTAGSFDPVVRALVAEYKALETRYPPPAVSDLSADSRWVLEVYATPLLDPHRGKYIAVADKKILGTGDTFIAAQVAAARAHHLHPAWFFVTYVDGPADFFFDPNVG